VSRPFICTFSATLVSAVLALGLAGCGGSGSTASQASTTVTTTSRPASAADKRIAHHVQLKLTDFPSGWEQQDKSPSKSTLKCPGVQAVKGTTTARQPSPDFVKSEGTEVDAGVYFFANVSSAKRAFERLSGQATRRCMADAVAKLLEREKTKGVKVGEITSGELSMPSVGDENILGRLTIPVTASGINVDVYLDLVFARQGRRPRRGDLPSVDQGR
jgi:hypothetical protein